jgi:LysM repeat protein
VADIRFMSRLKFAAVALCISFGVAGTAVPTAAAAPATASTQYYTVKAGDYLMGIASKMGVRLSDLLSANSLTVSSLIYPGMRLAVPAGGHLPAGSTSAGSTTAPGSYTVVRGDSLIGISLKLKVSLSSLLTLNRLTTSSLIYPGMKLSVPAGGTVPSSTAGAPAASSLVYVVKSGDTLIGIASRTKVTLSALLTVNKLSTSSFIYPGMRLAVPAGGVVPAPTTPTSPPVGDGSVSARLAPVIDFARAQLGKPYKFFSAGPYYFDCSGLTLAAYAQIGISLPHYSGAQIKLGTAVDWTSSPIKPGDLIFLESYPGSGVVSHVGIAVSSTQYIHATSAGNVVKIGYVSASMYRLIAVRRFVDG